MLADYLRAGIIPLGLQIKNIQGIFREDKKFWGGFSGIATTASRHWMVLGLETALEHSKAEFNEIEALKNCWGETP